MAENMTAEDHEMESASSFGKDDDHEFVPKFLTKKSRTSSVLKAVRSVVASKVPSPTEDSQVARDSKFDHGPIVHFPCFG
jgi:hypothetical protein